MKKKREWGIEREKSLRLETRRKRIKGRRSNR